MKKSISLNDQCESAILTGGSTPLQLLTESTADLSNDLEKEDQQDSPEWSQELETMVRRGLVASGHSETEVEQLSDILIRGFRNWVECNVVGKLARMFYESTCGTLEVDLHPAVAQEPRNLTVYDYVETGDRHTDLCRAQSIVRQWSCEGALDELNFAFQLALEAAIEQNSLSELRVDKLVAENELLGAQVSTGKGVE